MPPCTDDQLELSLRTWCVRAVVSIAAVVACCAGTPVHARAEPRQIFQLNAPVDTFVFVSSAALAVVPGVVGDGIVTPACPCDPNSVNALDRGAIGNSSQAAATASDVTAIVAIAAPVGVSFATLGASSAFLQDTLVFGQTVLVSNALANVVKLAVQRPRPSVYGTRDRALLASTSSYLSFYSGHTTLTFAALSAASMIWNLRYGPTLWPWIVTLLVGSSVAVERVLAGKHFATDVMVGAAAGVGEGVLIPYLHVKREGRPANGLTLVPIRRGAELVWSHEL